MLSLFISTILYPGGSRNNPDSTGFDWEHNYLSNLFYEIAINGANNDGRIWAILGMFILSITFAFFFLNYAKKLPSRNASLTVSTTGVGSMILTFLVVTPYHDMIIRIASTLALISIFYITVFIFKTKKYLLAILSVFELLVIYGALYIYFAQEFVYYLPLMQKLTLLVTIGWMLSLTYLSSQKDFELKTSMVDE